MDPRCHSCQPAQLSEIHTQRWRREPNALAAIAPESLSTRECVASVRSLSVTAPVGHRAGAEQGSAAVVRLLLAAGADAGLASRRGNTALGRARAKGHAAVVALLEPVPAAAEPEPVVAAAGGAGAVGAEEQERQVGLAVAGTCPYTAARAHRPTIGGRCAGVAMGVGVCGCVCVWGWGGGMVILQG